MESILVQSEESKAFVQELCFEFADEAASLWRVRQKAVNAPHYNLTDLLELDNRLEAQIDALRVADEPGWEECQSNVGRGRAEHFFTASILAFESNEEERIGIILEKAEKTPSVSEGIVSALGWMPWEQAQPHIKRLLLSKISIHQTIGIAASTFHRQDPGSFLENGFYSPDLTLKARSLKAAGVLGGHGDILIAGRLREQFQTADPACRFWAAWSAALLGDASALDLLMSFVLDFRSPFREDALQLILRKMDLKTALALHQELTKITDAPCLAVIGAGVIGDPALIPWLIYRMNIPALARIAGEAFTFITGAHISDRELEGKWPEGFEAGPNDDPKDSNVALDPDENLLWPDASKITVWWNSNKSNFKTGVRYLLGKHITCDHLRTVLQTGLQRQRTAAAMELALLEPGQPLYNTFAPAHRQLPKPEPHPGPAVIPNYSSRQLAITAVNCITPLGHNYAMTAASVRAGICRFRISDDYQDRNGNPITVAEIKGVRDNVKKAIERLADIAVLALKDLTTEYLDKYPRPVRLHFYLGVASGDRPGPDFGKKCSGLLKSVLHKQFGDAVTEVVLAGNGSLHEALNKAAKTIQRDPDTLCVIGCIDSLLNASTLDWLESGKRLHSSSFGRHHGLIAAEAAGFLIVEDMEKVKREGRAVLAVISSLGLSKEPNTRASNTSGICTGLPEACLSALDPIKHRNIAKIFSDMNGEDDRAREWNIASIRCFSDVERMPHLFNPAEYYGDIGAATGAVMASIVAQGFERNWLASPVMVFCSDDFGPCGAVVLEKELQKEEEETRPQESAQTKRPMTYLERKLADLKETNN